MWSHQTGAVRSHEEVGRFLTFCLMVCTQTMTNNIDAYDSRIYNVCKPWSGKRGDEYLRTFKPAFLNGLQAQNMAGWSLKQRLQGTDRGGQNGPAYVGTAADQRGQREGRATRANTLKSLVNKHILSDSIKQAIDIAEQKIIDLEIAQNAVPMVPAMRLSLLRQKRRLFASLW